MTLCLCSPCPFSFSFSRSFVCWTRWVFFFYKHGSESLARRINFWLLGCGHLSCSFLVPNQIWQSDFLTLVSGRAMRLPSLFRALACFLRNRPQKPAPRDGQTVVMSVLSFPCMTICVYFGFAFWGFHHFCRPCGSASTPSLPLWTTAPCPNFPLFSSSSHQRTT